MLCLRLKIGIEMLSMQLLKNPAESSSAHNLNELKSCSNSKTVALKASVQNVSNGS